MSGKIRYIAVLGGLLVAGVGLAACGGGVPSNAVAQIASTPIAVNTFDHWLKVAADTQAEQTGTKAVVPLPPHFTACIAALKAKSTKTTNTVLKGECETEYKGEKDEVMSFLISSEWVLQEAEKLGVKATDAEVEKELETLRKREFPKESDFKKFMETSGETVSDLELRVKLNLLGSRIEKKVTKKATDSVTEAAIKKFYELHKFETPYGRSESRDLLVVLTKTEAEANDAKQEIEKGKSFATVAKARSIDPTSKADGGKLEGVVKGEEEKAFEDAIFAAKQGVLSGPVKTPFGYYVFEVTKTTPGVQEPLAKVKSTIKTNLTTKDDQTAMSAFLKEFQKRWKTQTECREGYVVEDCTQYKKPKTTTSSSTTTTPGT